MLRRVFIVLLLVAAAPLTGVDGRAQGEGFITVEGPSLQARLSRAAQSARERTPGRRFLTVYAFDVRPGVAIDVKSERLPGGVGGDLESIIDSAAGTITFFHGTKVVVGSKVETRNLGVFILHEPDGGAVTQIEIHDLDAPRAYGEHPVYWLGRAGTAESLALLQSLVGSSGGGGLAERAAVAIALHQDAQLAPVLRKLFEDSRSEVVRKIAAFWFGQSSADSSFLAAVVRNEGESVGVRKQAAFSIGVGKDSNAVSVLRAIYPSVSNREVKKQIIYAASINADKRAAAAFIAGVADSDPDSELRKEARFRLGR
jgi:HEAT repeat protein